MKQASCYCTVCNRRVLATKDRTSHVFHLLMSIITFSVWFWVVWLPIMTASVATSYRCTRCGSKCNYAPSSMGRSLTGSDRDQYDEEEDCEDDRRPRTRRR